MTEETKTTPTLEAKEEEAPHKTPRNKHHHHESSTSSPSSDAAAAAASPSSATKLAASSSSSSSATTTVKPDPCGDEMLECMALMLKCRSLLRKMIEAKDFDNRSARGRLNAVELMGLLKTQKETSTSDMAVAQEIEQHKKALMATVRQNHIIEREVATLDSKIALLVRNVVQLQTSKKALKEEKLRRGSIAEGDGSASPAKQLTQAKLDKFSNLFYLLQTEPKYLARLVGVMSKNAGDLQSLLDTILLTLFGDGSSPSPREEMLLLSLFRVAINNEMANIII